MVKSKNEDSSEFGFGIVQDLAPFFIKTDGQPNIKDFNFGKSVLDTKEASLL